MERVLIPASISVDWAGLVIGIVALLVCILVVRHRCRQRDRMLRALIESFQKPLLFYNEYGRLVFYSSGLVLFDKKSSLKALRRVPARPTKNQPQAGELVIDHNRYRFVCRLFEYKPGSYGTLFYLEYVRSETVSD